MEAVTCNLCGSDDYRMIYSMPDARYAIEEWFKVVECLRCGLGFVNPRPIPPEMSRYYPPSFYDYFEDDRDFHGRRYAAEANFLKDVTSTDRKLLLDLGCANGAFPRFMRQLGWEVEGVETSRQSKPISDFKVYQQEFHDIPICEPWYDAITAWAVLEHVHNPMAYFRKAAQVLKQGGIFVFLVTNFKSISSRSLFLEDVPRHLYFFTEETVKKYLAETGFDLMKAEYTNRIYSMRPVNWLRHYFYLCCKRRKMEWKDIPFAGQRLGKKAGPENTLTERTKFLISNPFYALDRFLMPIFEGYQLLLKKYGIVIYVARKR
jgi:SAM-dependent methyltransferase